MERVIGIVVLVAAVCAVEALNDRPIVGVLTQPSLDAISQYGPKYIAASYVKYIESSGARVVPVQHDASLEELEYYFQSLNGILFPGGGASLHNTTLFQAGKFFYERSLEAYSQGDVFPVFGHCLGFEMLVMITSEDFGILSPTACENISLALEFTEEMEKSRMFAKAPKHVINMLSNPDLPVTMNNHHWGLFPRVFESTPKLNSFYRPLSTNKDKLGQEFISTFEGIDAPVYGIQWHAEKPLFEWNPNEAIQHAPEAVVSMQYMSNFLVSQARLSNHRFPSTEDEEKAVIYNYPPVYTYEDVNDFEQCYMFGQ
mmetsp:Transcript_16614/g.46908  ORF Transcript_16614/g.46908 Transcript_16614/m.46908 type:complete len:314 (+) Transcript_16614:125-1066(+)|eukprot:CAMPEP_0119131214 /NCGR_PEP_ID=MMETSP1310-20130426/9751_1 /TAXON_ID=464262 /ORGANISM="Genus nov. species nov., Strain RCC2339" /LENGTH=313 /DNA_ID=CAMNT_0007121769 /DNA_START=48 /DNA_END=989 /DNA_ORIENTATION=-